MTLKCLRKIRQKQCESETMRRWSKVQSPRQGTYGHPPGFPGCCTCPPGLGDKSRGLRAEGAGCEPHAGCRGPWMLLAPRRLPQRVEPLQKWPEKNNGPCSHCDFPFWCFPLWVRITTLLPLSCGPVLALLLSEVHHCAVHDVSTAGRGDTSNSLLYPNFLFQLSSINSGLAL